MERLVNIVNGFKPLSIFARSSILDVWQGAEYASDSGQWLKDNYNLIPLMKSRKSLFLRLYFKWNTAKKTSDYPNFVSFCSLQNLTVLH